MKTVSILAFNSEIVETILVKRKGETKPVRINESDFDEKAGMTKFNPREEEQKAALERPAHVNDEPALNASLPPAVAPSAPYHEARADGGMVAPTTPSPAQHFVKMEGTGKKAKYHITDATGSRFNHPSINPEGYASEKEAWDAALMMRYHPNPVHPQTVVPGEGGELQPSDPEGSAFPSAPVAPGST